jgi:hypothetical protein
VKKSLPWAAAAVALSVSSATYAVDFSADSVAHNSTGQTRTIKVYSSNGKVRVEPVGADSYEILDTAKRAGYIIYPQKKLCRVQPQMMAIMNSAAYSVAANPCVKISLSGGLATCKRLADDKVNGRATERWEVTRVSPGGKNNMGLSYTLTVWVDRGLGAIVKSQGPRGILEYQNLRIGPQSPNLFAVPAGYKTEQIPMPKRAPGVPNSGVR